MLKNIFERIIVIIPWIFIGWIVGRGLNGDMDGLLVFVLVIILIPLAIVLNIVTIVVFKGRAVLKRLRQAQSGESTKNKPIKSTNYADLPWWNPKRWL